MSQHIRTLVAAGAAVVAFAALPASGRTQTCPPGTTNPAYCSDDADDADRGRARHGSEKPRADRRGSSSARGAAAPRWRGARR